MQIRKAFESLPEEQRAALEAREPADCAPFSPGRNKVAQTTTSRRGMPRVAPPVLTPRGWFLSMSKGPRIAMILGPFVDCAQL